MRPGPPTTRLLLVVLTLLAAACGGNGGDAEDGATSPTAAAPAPIVPSPPANEPASIAGSWFVLAPELPYHGLRMTLQPTEAPGIWEGSWLSFDWRGSKDAARLHRTSRRVAIAGRRIDDRLVVTGPAPQIDENGRPNGGKGLWELTVERASLPGEELRFAGTLVNPEYTSDEGTPAVVVQSLQPWAP